MVQDELRWLLAAIADEWPAGEFADEDVVRIDRDEPEVLETGQRRKSVDHARYASIGVTEGDVVREPLGTEFLYDVETVLDVRIEGIHQMAGGTIPSKSDFKRLTNYTQAAIDARRSYPTVEADDPIGAVAYLELKIEDETSLSSNHADDFGNNFSVRLRGRQDPDLR